jgi:hypothetical protein
MASWLAANNNTIKSYFDLHSYSEEFMYPYGYADVLPDDVAKIVRELRIWVVASSDFPTRETGEGA